MRVSLSNPVMRESMVKLLIFAAADNKFTGIVLQISGGGGSLPQDKL
jgi:hypothetical protein